MQTRTFDGEDNSREPGDSTALFNLALLLADEGGAKNIARAKALYERALELGDNPDTMNNLALLLEDEGGAKNIARTKALYERALELCDDPDTMHNLAMLLADEGSIDNLIKAAQLYRQSLLIRHDADTKEYLLSLLAKTTNLHVQYHVHMLKMTNDKIPDEVIEIFNEHPEEVIRFMLTDSLLTEPQKQVVLDHIAQHYVSLASKADNDPTIILSLYSKIPEGASDYLEALIMQSNILFSAIMDNHIEPKNLIPTLQDIIKIDESALRTIENNLIIKSKTADLSPEESSLINLITSILATPYNRIDKTIAKLALNISPSRSRYEKNLHIYIGHKRKLDHYAKPLRQYLVDVRNELDALALAQQTYSPSNMWKEGLSQDLRLAQITLKAPGRLPKTTNGIINLAATVLRHILDDNSNAGCNLVEMLPSFADIPRKRVEKSAGL